MTRMAQNKAGGRCTEATNILLMHLSLQICMPLIMLNFTTMITMNVLR